MALKTVVLPDGKSVKVSTTPMQWWDEEGGSGYIDPRLIAPDPEQPRKHMSPEELAELKESVQSIGVRQHVIITPRSRAPWAAVAAEDKSLPFLAVSGHRRRRVSIESGIDAIPVIVRIYENEEDHRVDAFVLNKQHKDLSPIEEGWEIVRLNRAGISFAKIAKKSGDSLGYVENRRNLTKLLPAIQALISPEVSAKKQLPITVAGELGGVGTATREEIEELHITFDEAIAAQRNPALKPYENIWDFGEGMLQFELQKILLAVILHRKLSAAQAKDFIEERKLVLASAGHKATQSERFQPARRKAILMNMAQSVRGSKAADWTPSEFDRIFESATAVEMETYRLAFNDAISLMGDFAKLMKRIEDAKRFPSRVHNGPDKTVLARRH